MSSISLSPSRSWVGSALLVAGTAIGAGMLGLPVALAQANFSGACLAILLVWAFMFASGLLLAWAFCERPACQSLSALCKSVLPSWLQRLTSALFIFLYGLLLVAYAVGGPPLLGGLLSLSGPVALVACSLCIGAVLIWWLSGPLERLESSNRTLMGILLICFVL